MKLQVDLELDLSGFTCPLPLLKSKQALNKLEVGNVLKVVATDPGSERDFHVFAEQSNISLVKYLQVEDKYYYWLLKDA